MSDIKKKKTNVKREVRLGVWALLVSSPMIILGFLLSVSAIITGIGYIQAGDFRFRTGIELVAIFTVVVAIYLGMGYLYIRRLKQLYRRGQQLGAEHNRVTEMVASQSAQQRLMDKPTSHANLISTQEESANKQAT